jgi:hypothetical protein
MMLCLLSRDSRLEKGVALSRERDADRTPCIKTVRIPRNDSAALYADLARADCLFVHCMQPVPIRTYYVPAAFLNSVVNS